MPNYPRHAPIPVGQTFGLRTVLAAAKHPYKKDVHVLAECQCGDVAIVSLCEMRSGRRTACHACANIQRCMTHGETDSPEYEIWCGIKKRTNNPDCEGWQWYGARGIKMCDRWKHSFENFLADMGRRPSPTHSIDRIDVNGNYEPSNCRWATPEVQSANRRLPTHCRQGHEYTENNTYRAPNGQRVCKECRKRHKRAFRARQ